MTTNAWPAMLPFDPNGERFPPALEVLFARPAATIPALLLIAGPAARRSGWAARAALALAARWGERRGGIILADLGAEAPELGPLLGERSSEGLADIFEFGASLRHVARKVADHAFQFLPPGAYLPDAEQFLRHPRWTRLIAQCAEDQATLLAYVPAEASGLDHLAGRTGRALLLAGPDEPGKLAAALPSGCEVVMVLRPGGRYESAEAAASPSPRSAGKESQPRAGSPASTPFPVFTPVAAGPVSEDEELSEPPRMERRPPAGRRVSPLVRGVLIAMLGIGGWVGFRTFLDAPAAVPLPEAVAPTMTPPAPAEEVAKPIEATPLPYSVAIEAYPDFAPARERLQAFIQAEPTISFYLAPVLLDTVVYYRIMAGPSADSASASALMSRLVERGYKTDHDAWAIRPTQWAFLIGDFESREAAVARAEELGAKGVPTYTVPIAYTAGPPRIRLYAGAFEGAAQADVMAQMLRDAGISAPLVRRTGQPSQ